MGRRSISVKGITYRRFGILCKQQDVAMSAHLEELITGKLDRLGVPRSDVEETPVTLWECSHGESQRLVAARDKDEAAGFAANVLGCQKKVVRTEKVEREYDQSKLIPGVLPPDEVRAALP